MNPWDEVDWTDTTAVIAVAETVAHSGDIERCEQLLEAAQATFSNQLVATHLLGAVFRDEPTQLPRLASSLTPLQRAVLSKIASLGVVQGASVYSTLESHRIPAMPRDLRRYLGLDDAGPLDREVDGRPIWVWFRDVQEGRRTATELCSQLKQHLSAAEILDVCRDAGEGGYTLGRLWPYQPGDLEREAQGFDALALFLSDIMEGVDREALTDLANTLDAVPNYGAMPLYAATARALARTTADPEPIVDRLTTIGMAHRRTVRDVLATLSVERRLALIKPLGLTHAVRGGVAKPAGAWHYVDLCPCEDAVEWVVETITQWGSRDTVPEERAIEVLRTLGPIAKRPCPRADLFDRAAT